jgi:hypothetical protein
MDLAQQLCLWADELRAVASNGLQFNWPVQIRVPLPLDSGTAGAPGAIRTRSLRIRSPTLCPIELRGQLMYN